MRKPVSPLSSEYRTHCANCGCYFKAAAVEAPANATFLRWQLQPDNTYHCRKCVIKLADGKQEKLPI